MGDGHIESFHDKLRDECLNRELFGNLHEARVILESWRVEYNERRPHSSLGYRTPNQYAQVLANQFDGGCAPQTPRRSPRQAFGGNLEATPQGGEQTKRSPTQSGGYGHEWGLRSQCENSCPARHCDL